VAYRYDPKKVWARVNACGVHAGGKAITVYGMRHALASTLLKAGVSDLKVSQWLGHSDTKMIYKHYEHLLCDDNDITAVSYNPSGVRAAMIEKRDP
jgi:site-specific recombinase XerD